MSHGTANVLKFWILSLSVIFSDVLVLRFSIVHILRYSCYQIFMFWIFLCYQMFMLSVVHVISCSYSQMFKFSDIHVIRCSCSEYSCSRFNCSCFNCSCYHALRYSYSQMCIFSDIHILRYSYSHVFIFSDFHILRCSYSHITYSQMFMLSDVHVSAVRVLRYSYSLRFSISQMFMLLDVHVLNVHVIILFILHLFGSTVAQWLSAWHETKGPRVQATPASLRCGPWARHIYLSLVLIQPRKTRPFLTERLLMGRKDSNQTNKQTISVVHVMRSLYSHYVSRCSCFSCSCYVHVSVVYILIWSCYQIFMFQLFMLSKVCILICSCYQIFMFQLFMLSKVCILICSCYQMFIFWMFMLNFVDCNFQYKPLVIKHAWLKTIFLFLNQNIFFGALNKCLNETVLMSTLNKC